MSRLRRLASRSAVAILGASVALARAGCGGPSAPTPGTSPNPGGSPSARPSSTALENLSLIRNLETATGRQSILYFVFGDVTQAGVLSPNSAWNYGFYAPETSPFISYNWSVYTDGRVQFREGSLVRRGIEFIEMQPRLRIDSPQAVRLALDYGARAYANRYPDALVLMSYRYIGRQPICQMRFFVLSVPGTTRPCELGPILIHAETGELMLRDLSCNDQLP